MRILRPVALMLAATAAGLALTAAPASAGNTPRPGAPCAEDKAGTTVTVAGRRLKCDRSGYNGHEWKDVTPNTPDTPCDDTTDGPDCKPTAGTGTAPTGKPTAGPVPKQQLPVTSSINKHTVIGAVIAGLLLIITGAGLVSLTVAPRRGKRRRPARA